MPVVAIKVIPLENNRYACGIASQRVTNADYSELEQFRALAETASGPPYRCDTLLACDG
jgi:hypothetical protein